MSLSRASFSKNDENPAPLVNYDIFVIFFSRDSRKNHLI